MDRRSLLAALGALAASPAWAQPRSRRLSEPFHPALAEIERRSGGRLGVFGLDIQTRRSFAWRADERFTLCSTFKLPLAAQMLARIDGGQEKPARKLFFGPGEVLFASPVTAKHAEAGGLDIAGLTRAIVEFSDNTAANLLLREMGGPEGLTRWLRAIGDEATRADRYEPDANLYDPILDTTTPRAINQTMRRILLGNVLSPKSRGLLEGWMIASPTGANRLRAAFPKHWIAGGKTGTSSARQSNDIVFARPPGRRPVFIAAYYDAPLRNPDAREAVLRDVGRAFTAWLSA